MFNSRRALVAMSGGVDSSVVAALMVQEGFEVIGVTMKLDSTSPQAAQEADEAIKSAQEVAKKLGVEHRVVDLQARFREEIVEYFVSTYLQGRTPNPCAKCNEKIKFGALMEVADQLNAQWLATGHYAKRIRREARWALLRGQDPNKDQSYFLARIKRDALARIRFPLGERSKDETRAIAASLNLSVAQRKDSQDICFVHGSYIDVIEELASSAPSMGNFVNSSGEVLGAHKGIHRYTLGQRRGLGIPAPNPLYVQAFLPNHDIVLGPREGLRHHGLVATDANWLMWKEPPPRFSAQVKIRYRSKPIPCEVEASLEGFSLTFTERVEAITPGQAAVLYVEDEVAGGGWIKEPMK